MSSYRSYADNKLLYFRLREMSSTQLIGGNVSENINYGFYFTHFVSTPDTVFQILKDGCIKLSKDVPIENRVFSGTDPIEYLYTNIQFDDVNNLQPTGDVTLLLSPQLFYDFDLIFNKAWLKFPVIDSIYVYNHDSLEIKENKLQQIKKYVFNPTFYADTPLGKIVGNLRTLGRMSHEILFTKQIPLEQYLIGILCPNESDEFKETIRDLIKTYPNAKILDYTQIDGEYRYPLYGDVIMTV